MFQVDGRRLSADDFMAKYALAGRPVVLRGAAANWSDAKTRWTRSALLSHTADVTTAADTIPYGEIFGLPAQRRERCGAGVKGGQRPLEQMAPEQEYPAAVALD